MDAVDTIFVYGTLMRGECRYGALGGRENALSIEPATVEGRLVDCGDYPGFVHGAGRVAGELVRVRDVETTLARLDRIEGYLGPGVAGSLYDRTLVDATDEGGQVRRAWIYTLVDPTGLSEIPSGSWRDRRATS